MDSPVSLVAQVAVSDGQPRPLRSFIPLRIVAALLVLGIIVYITFKLVARIRKSTGRGENHSENLEQLEDLESTAGHSSVTCCGTVEESKELKSRSPSIAFEAEVEEIAKYHDNLLFYNVDLFARSPVTEITPARRSSSIFITRSDLLPLPARAHLQPPSPRRAPIPATWSDPCSRWADQTRLGPQRKVRYPSYRPATSPVQEPKELAPELLRRSNTSLLWP
ncbi:unnamed protein product [Rhizoctonia solani]|uniref:Uncharacterized protein n=1 Tax=Rhizoctonia solani TaxID=456999 RepID=A0A8H3DBC1_9AGAM|nr:unnamed protein product [Rhizoctonia solani]CAE6518828.1 unnamed protein product [Rhizoctonia solani]